MGFLIDDILLFPIKGVFWIGEKLKEQAESELNSESRIQEELLALQLKLEAGGMTEEEYAEKERKLLARLDEIMRLREERR